LSSTNDSSIQLRSNSGSRSMSRQAQLHQRCACALNSNHPCSLSCDQVESLEDRTCTVLIDSALWSPFNAHNSRLLVNFWRARTMARHNRRNQATPRNLAPHRNTQTKVETRGINHNPAAPIPCDDTRIRADSVVRALSTC
jgi:hypothetical protein